MECPESKHLAGEATPGLHGFSDPEGNTVHGFEAIFPIVRQIDEDCLELVGTGFFINENGLFVSAKHVLLEPFDQNSNQTHPIALLHLWPNYEYLIRHITWCSSHNTADVAIGFVEPEASPVTNASLRNKVLTLTTSSPRIGETVVTYAYPKTRVEQIGSKQVLNLKPAFYDGKLEEYLPNGEGLLKGPCYRTNIFIHGGASGGPVVGKFGRVFAINSASFNGAENTSCVSRIDEIIGLEVCNLKLSNGQEVKSTTVLELAHCGWIDFDPPLTG